MYRIKLLCLVSASAFIFSCADQECDLDRFQDSDLNHLTEFHQFTDEEKLSSTQAFSLDFDGLEDHHVVSWEMNGESHKGATVTLHGTELETITVTVTDGPCRLSRSFEHYFGTVILNDQIFICDDADHICEAGIATSSLHLIEVNLYSVEDGQPDVLLATEYTDPFGRYLFNCAPVGDYIIGVKTGSPNVRVLTKEDCDDSIMNAQGFSEVLSFAGSKDQNQNFIGLIVE